MNGTRGLVIAVVAAFIVGCSAGLVGGILFTRFAPQTQATGRFERGGQEGPRRGGPPRRRGPTLEMLERRLDLTPEQRQRVEVLLEQSRKGYAQVRESTHAAIERELTPAQREEWKKLETRFPRERRRDSGRPPWRGDRP
jgi:Spy/CpxP family protein refolding chaperone